MDCGCNDDPVFQTMSSRNLTWFRFKIAWETCTFRYLKTPPTDNGSMSTYIFVQQDVIDRNLLCSAAILSGTKEVKGASDISLENFANWNVMEYFRVSNIIGEKLVLLGIKGVRPGGQFLLIFISFHFADMDSVIGMIFCLKNIACLTPYCMNFFNILASGLLLLSTF